MEDMIKHDCVEGAAHLHDNLDILFPRDAIYKAKSQKMFALMHDRGCRIDSINAVARSGNLSLLKFILGLGGYAITDHTVDCAVVSGNVEMVRYLHAMGHVGRRWKNPPAANPEMVAYLTRN